MTTSPFWRRVRQLRKEIAIKLYMEDHRDMDVYVTPSIRELKEGGYWSKAHKIALKEVSLRELSLKTLKGQSHEEK